MEEEVGEIKDGLGTQPIHGALELLTLELILSNRVLYIDDSTVTRREK